MRFPPFRLELWLSAHEHAAERVLGTSGVASAPLAALGPVALPDVLDYGEVPGDPRLEEAVARWQGVPRERVLLTVGATEADFLVALATLGPGDVALVESPTYPPLALVPHALGARVERVERRFERGFRLDIDALARRVRRGDVKLVSLSNPNNPTGAVTPASDLVAIAEAAEDAGAWVLVDEIFRDLAFGAPLPVAATLHPRLVSTSSLTKCYGLSGLRCGWVLAPPELRAPMREAKGLTTIVNGIVDETLALAAIERRADLLARARRIVDANHAELTRFMARRTDVDWVAPQAAPLSAPRLVDGGSDVALCEDLLARERTLLVPGSFMDLPGHVRLGFGGEPAGFADGLARLERYLDAQ